MKDILIDPVELSFSPTEELVHYLETKGDYINSALCPSVVYAEDVYRNISSYIIIDVRSPLEFSAGHIENAVNVQPADLFAFVDSSDKSRRKIIVSKNGQSSAYYTALLRLAGYTEIYSLNFGMAEWHSDFANNWFEATMGFNRREYFVGAERGKADFSKFPEINFGNPSAPPEEKIKERASQLMNEKFPEVMESYVDKYLSIDRARLFNRQISEDYIICFGNRDMYVYLERGLVIGHIIGSVHYLEPPYSDLRSSAALQTIPADKKIFIYSYDGVLSAFAVAYLRLLGYDAVSILYGLNAFYPDLMPTVLSLQQYVFDQSRIMNYPYIKE